LDPVLCLISDRRTDASPEALIDRVAAAARAGVHLIQVREPDLDGRALCDLVRACLRVAAGTLARIIVNDRLDVALAAGADGVHLREESFPASAARAIAPPGFLVGRSLHRLEDVGRRSVASGLDYVLFGPIFATTSKPETTPIGPAALASAVRSTPLPVLALGGVTPANAAEVAATGAAGVAGIGLWTTASSVAETARAVATAFRRADR
jgi:thiamine-phosphate pyrophosphorylase